MNGAVTGIDVVRQEVDDGVLKSERLLQSHFHIPSWVTKVSYFSPTSLRNKLILADGFFWNAILSRGL